MAFTRKALEALGLNKEQREKVMILHGTSLSGFFPKSALQAKISEALADAQKYTSLDITMTDEYRRLVQERDMFRQLSSDTFASVKPKFRETVYHMLDWSTHAPPIATQMMAIAETYEEYFVKHPQVIDVSRCLGDAQQPNESLHINVYLKGM